ncbi:MAG TPA: AMP-binding protein [Candidatus Deferrimicrobium sp.]|nr:AMP-binding protein [Candidatus Deferrimicrobium sp.]
MHLNLVSDFLVHSASVYPDKIALYFDDATITYRQLHRHARNLAGYLAANGLKRGDRVIIYLQNSPETVVSIFGTLLAGGAFSVVNQTVKAAKFQFILHDCSPTFIITDNSKIDMLQELQSEVGRPQLLNVDGASGQSADFHEIIENDSELPGTRIIDLEVAAIIYTSGTTGDPKGVALTHRNLVTSAKSIMTYLENGPSDIVLCVLPLSFGYGLCQVLVSVLSSGAVVLERKFGYPYQLVKLIQDRRVTGFPGVPTMWAILLQMEELTGDALSSVRYITNAGAALPPAYVPRIKKMFPNARFYAMYGLTECIRVCYLPPDLIDKKPDSVGFPMPNTEVFVVDENGNFKDRGATGQLVIRGSHVMPGYWNNPEGTAKVLKPGRFPWEKVLYTGDMFRLDDDGFMYFVGRMDDIIKVRGERVSPKEIEHVLYQLEDVVETRAIPVPDEITGSAIRAEVVLRKDSKLTVDAILHHCRQNLEDLMVPKYIAVVESLPKSESGKILKR